MMDHFHIEPKANKHYAIRDIKGKTWYTGYQPWIEDLLDVLNRAYEAGYQEGLRDASV